jgi:sulfate-transporting ATPase
MFYVQLAVLGLVSGAAYALSSTGLVAIYKGAGVLNFAQGTIGMVGTYVYANWVIAGKNAAVGLLLGVGTSALLGLLVFAGVMRPLRRRPPVVKMVASFGVLLLLEGLAALRWSTTALHVPYLIHQHEYRLGRVTIGSADLLAIGMAVLVAIVLSLFFARTTWGRATEAAARREEVVARLGYRTDLLAASAWTVGSALAGLGGILIAPSIGLTQTILTLVLIQALAAALVGGFRSVGLTVAAAFAVGAMQSILTGAFPNSPGWSQSVPFFAVVLVLLLRGRGIPSRDAVGVERLPAAPFPRVSWRWCVAGLLAFGLGPVLLTSYWASVAVLGAGFALVVLSIVVVTGFVGQVSLAQWGVAGVGAFISADLASRHGWTMIPAMAVSIAAGIVVGLVVGFPALRIRGIDLAVVTLGAGVAVQGLILNTFWGSTGLTAPTPDLFGAKLSERGYLYVAEVIVLGVAAATWAIRRSGAGQRLVAVRGSERAAAAAGVRPAAVKLLAFAGSAGIAALGGSIWGFGALSLQTASFDPITSVSLLSFAFICGVGSVGAGVTAGLAVGLGPIFFTNILHIEGTAWFNIIGGLGVILTLLQHPDGIYVRTRSPRRSGHSRGRRVDKPEQLAPLAAG